MIMKIEKLDGTTYTEIAEFDQSETLIYCIVDGEDEYEFQLDGMWDHRLYREADDSVKTPYVKVEFLTDAGFILASMKMN